ncbi:MAG TPA: helix-turn-helix domain-containing protein [Anaeromyxobacteraceae bacterium]|nr:helix-turn-helix domain-containing protein [Anaeromyxobacteraceae bacterium]
MATRKPPPCAACRDGEGRATTTVLTFALARCRTTASARVAARTCRACGAVAVDPQVEVRARLAVGCTLADHGVHDGEAFRHLRRALGLRAAELARLLDVTPETISHWETGKSTPARGAFVALAALAQDALDGRTATRDRLAAMADGRRWPRALSVELAAR